MTKKIRTRLNKVLHNPRQAQQLMEEVSIADGREVFDACYLLTNNLQAGITSLAPLIARKKAAPPTSYYQP